MLLAAPLLVPLATALLAALAWRRPRLQRAVSLAGAVGLLAFALALAGRVMASGPVSLALAGWPLPYGIGLTADRLSAALVVVSAVLALSVLVYDLAGGVAGEARAMRLPLVHGLLAGTGGAFLAADLFNLYVWFELMFIAVLGLLVVEGGRAHREAAFKYFALNMLGTLVFLAAVALLYGATGQLNFHALAAAARRPEVAGALPVYVALLAAAFLLKAGAFPLFYWLPASYHVLPASLLALIGGLVTKVGLYALLRLSGQVFTLAPAVFYQALGWIAAATMVSGVLGAAYHWDLRRILAFHIISQIGYLLLAVALASPRAAAAGLFFLVHNILAKAALFLIAGLIWRAAGHYDLRRIGGLYPVRPGLAVLFLIAGFSLVGVPPSSGFWGKFLLVQTAFAQGDYAWGGIALAVGALTLYSMVKIWLEGFWKPHPDGALPAAVVPVPAYGAVMVLVGLLVVLGLYPQPFVHYAQVAAAGLWAGRGP